MPCVSQEARSLSALPQPATSSYVCSSICAQPWREESTELSDKNAADPFPWPFLVFGAFGALFKLGISLVQLCYVMKSEELLFFLLWIMVEASISRFSVPKISSPNIAANPVTQRALSLRVYSLPRCSCLPAIFPLPSCPQAHACTCESLKPSNPCTSAPGDPRNPCRSALDQLHSAVRCHEWELLTVIGAIAVQKGVLLFPWL